MRERLYHIEFYGRECNAIGITYKCRLAVRAWSEEEAIMKLYETHEHIHDARIVEIND